MLEVHTIIKFWVFARVDQSVYHGRTVPSKWHFWPSYHRWWQRSGNTQAEAVEARAEMISLYVLAPPGPRVILVHN